MANDSGHGGYRQPSRPSPVSLPGRESSRTDRGPRQMDVTGQPYGAAQEFRAQQSSAPLSAAPGSPGGGSPEPVAMPTPLHAATMNPDEPVTAGADAGAGPSMLDAGIVNQNADADLKARLGPALPALMRMADSQYATSDFKEQVRNLIARIS